MPKALFGAFASVRSPFFLPIVRAVQWASTMTTAGSIENPTNFDSRLTLFRISGLSVLKFLKNCPKRGDAGESLGACWWEAFQVDRTLQGRYLHQGKGV